MRYITVLILVFIPTLALAGTAQIMKHINLSARGINMLVVNCGAGSLDLRGVEGLAKIKVTAEVEVKDFKKEKLEKFIEKNVRLNLLRQENKALLRSEIQKKNSKDIEARINLTIEVPMELDMKITDSSGPIKVKDIIGNLKINDGSGEIIIENIVGKLAVYDDSGSIQIEDIQGNAMVKDGSGFIEIDYVKGDVFVTDGSGQMTIRHIDGNVTVSDGSGDIDISDVSENVFISEAGSGELEIERIRGKATILE
jgi:DUF4097 and DUF4098 domain-containing protein YvlB